MAHDGTDRPASEHDILVLTTYITAVAKTLVLKGVITQQELNDQLLGMIFAAPTEALKSELGNIINKIKTWK
jgi:hypothetical protein